MNSDTLATTGHFLTYDTHNFIVGDRVWVNGVHPARIIYIGGIDLSEGEWAGVVLDDPIGKNDGVIGGKRYFQCEPNRGLFIRLWRLTREPLVHRIIEHEKHRI